MKHYYGLINTSVNTSLVAVTSPLAVANSRVDPRVVEHSYAHQFCLKEISIYRRRKNPQ